MMNHRTGPHLNTLGQVVVEQFYLLQYTLIVSKGHADRLAFWQSWVCFEASKDSEKDRKRRCFLFMTHSFLRSLQRISGHFRSSILLLLCALVVFLPLPALAPKTPMLFPSKLITLTLRFTTSAEAMAWKPQTRNIDAKTCSLKLACSQHLSDLGILAM